jgi:PTH1 family peptidyl-tRNA hydrolase
MSGIELIVGLGNPGREYEGTRHNAGEDFVRELARQAGGTFRNESKFFGEVADVLVGTRKLRLLVPTTFMNRSGRSVAALANFYRIEPDRILIAHDELDVPPGSARFKFDGGHGGHNGLRDIVPALGNRKDFYRLRIGIGHPGSAKQVSAYVLSKASPGDQEAIRAAIDEALRALPLLLDGDSEKAMTRLHSFDGSDKSDAVPGTDAASSKTDRG